MIVFICLHRSLVPVSSTAAVDGVIAEDFFYQNTGHSSGDVPCVQIIHPKTSTRNAQGSTREQTCFDQPAG